MSYLPYRTLGAVVPNKSIYEVSVGVTDYKSMPMLVLDPNQGLVVNDVSVVVRICPV